MGSEQILIAEDDEFVAEDLQARLTGLGYDKFLNTSRAHEAVWLVECLKPDLVLLDIGMPGEMDGIEAGRQIRELETAVVYVTGYCEGPILERAKMTEPCGYILKPYETRHLKTTIEMGLHKHRAEQERARVLKQLQATVAT